jgi:micrococcal nuclease
MFQKAGFNFSSALLFTLLAFLSLPALRVFSSPSLQEARVIAVNDGDTVTLRMNGKEYRTRLVGIDGPEMGQEPWGERSRQHLRKILKEAGWNVFVETDIRTHDKYNRLLVYLWDHNKRLINEQMLLDGYAVLFTIPPNTAYTDRFKRAQRIARERKLGIWGPDGLKERPLEYKKTHPRE